MQQLTGFVDSILRTVRELSFLDAIDMLIVAVLIYFVLKIAKQTRAMQVLKGIALIFVLARITEMLGLSAVTWLMNSLLSAGLLVIVIIFQPDIRRALEQLGQGRFFANAGAFLQAVDAEDYSWAGEEIFRAMLNLSKNKVGALLVVQQNDDLTAILETGTRLDALVSQPLIENIFVNGSPLHDGAMLIHQGRMLGAGCFLPLSEQKLNKSLGTRHRAAVGLSEASDAVVLIVSEETGIMSMAHKGVFSHNIDVALLREQIEGLFGTAPTPVSIGDWFRRRSRQ